MFGRNNAPVVHEVPAPVAIETLAGSAAFGGSGGSGMVAPWNRLPTIPLTPATRRQVVQNVDLIPDLTPDSYYADRALYGGQQTLSAFTQFKEEAPFPGGYRVMTGRPPMPEMAVEQMGPSEYESPTEWRDVPPVVSLCRSIPTVLSDNGFSGSAGIR